MLFTATTVALGDIQRVDPISVEKDFVQWQQRILKMAEELKEKGAYPRTGYMECAELQELKNAFFCIGDEKVHVNAAFARTSIYADGFGANGKVKQWVSLNEPVVEKGKTQVSGHDIFGEDLRKMYESQKELCKKDKSFCLTVPEKELFEDFLPPLFKSKEPFVIIAFGIGGQRMKSSDIAAHEVLHAQYYLQDEFKKAVIEFYSEEVIDSKEETQMKKAFEGTYNLNNPDLMVNEFQAHVLQTGAEKGKLSLSSIPKNIATSSSPNWKRRESLPFQVQQE